MNCNCIQLCRSRRSCILLKIKLCVKFWLRQKLHAIENPEHSSNSVAKHRTSITLTFSFCSGQWRMNLTECSISRLATPHPGPRPQNHPHPGPHQQSRPRITGLLKTMEGNAFKQICFRPCFPVGFLYTNIVQKYLNLAYSNKISNNYFCHVQFTEIIQLELCRCNLGL